MSEKKINFYYYSGTGNTELVVKKMAKTFRAGGIETNLFKIENTRPESVDISGITGLGFPVAFQSTFPFLWKFFKNMPHGSNNPVFMVDTLMSFSGAIVGPLKKMLTDKGYNCIGAREITMPNNFLPKIADPQKNMLKIEQGIAKAEEYASELLEGKTTWRRIPFLSKGFYNLCCNKFMMNSIISSFAKKINVNRDKCIKCGLCAAICPKQNITMPDFPKWHDSCELCTRCINLCPQKAVGITGKKFKKYKAVNPEKCA
jgi:ferredoxin/flavodoxin